MVTELSDGTYSPLNSIYVNSIRSKDYKLNCMIQDILLGAGTH